VHVWRQARYHGHRSKTLLTVLGPVQLERAYARDRELDVEGQESSPGVRRMMALVGGETSFDRGRQQPELLAGLKATAKAVERQSEAIGADIAAREQEQDPSRQATGTTRGVCAHSAGAAWRAAPAVLV